jgi:GNAT superfamily N-acetyltransferase
MRDAGNLYWRAEENLKESFRAMARYAMDGAVLEVDRACMIATGVPQAFYNPVFLQYAPDDADGLVQRARAFYGARGNLPWSLVLTVWDGDTPLLGADRLADAGLVPAGAVPVVHRETQDAEPWLPVSLRVRIETVADTPELLEYRDTLTKAFGVPGYVSELLFPHLPPPNIRLYLATLGGQAVGTAALLDAGGVAGVYNIGVHPGFRRRGIGTALVNHALEEACWGLSLPRGVAQVSRAALPLFTSLGFETIGTCYRYAEPGHLPPGEEART